VVDWGSVPYPPWWIARAAARRRELDVAVERLRTVVAGADDIVGALIFGSYASGKVGPASDLDIMLVTTLPAGDDPGNRYAQLAQRLALGVPCDLLVYEVEEFATLVRERPFVTQARREGIWIGAATPA
jgi:predicted nucleotidyltransferase